MRKQTVRVINEQGFYVVSGGSAGPRGEMGPAGPSGGSSIVVTSDIAIGGNRAVVVDASNHAQYASNQTLTHANKVVGISINAAAAGDSINVLRSGEITEPSWNWTLDQPVYLADNGTLTQTPPSNPALFSLIVGFPITATKLFVSIREPIIF